MDKKRFLILSVLVLAVSLGIPLLIEWRTTPKPVDRHIHIEAFRYGTSPAIVRVNRGDRLFFTFSTRDTGHSFFLQDYRVDAKIPPASDTVDVFDPFHPEAPSAAGWAFVRRQVGLTLLNLTHLLRGREATAPVPPSAILPP